MKIQRRTALKSAAALIGGASLPKVGSAAPKAGGGASIIIAPSSKPVVETTLGKVRGYIARDIYTFKGIPYGADTGGASRFMPPVKAKPWNGLRSSMYYGQVSPQGPRSGWKNDEESFMFEWDDGQPGEDCLRVNVWTQGVNDNRKRPVMVWLHGGGFSAGSGQELKAYDGESLARRGDVVLVSLNHRLNALGYLNLAAYGSQYAASGNVGMMDTVLALEWVRGNIANFGGDPSNVTIFGQSGGGSKVSTLMAMPSAKGLFHKAIIESGSQLRQSNPEESARLAAAYLAELGLSSSQVSKLHELPAEQLMTALAGSVRRANPQAGNPGGGGGWRPTVDGQILPVHPFDPAGPSQSANVPLMVGTVLNEQTHGINHPEYESMPDVETKKRFEERYPGRWERASVEYRKLYPKAKPFDILSVAFAAQSRQNAVTQCERFAALKGAPVYLWWFTWQTPVLDGRPRAFHCSELPFVFNNTDRAAAMTGGTADARDLGGRVSDAWINFARKGDPNHAGLPKWAAFATGKAPVMIFDSKCEVKLDPDGEARRAVLG
jgi:para-nitrobenzyl esterase